MVKEKKFKFDNSVLIKEQKKIDGHILHFHAKFYKNPLINSRVMGL